MGSGRSGLSRVFVGRTAELRSLNAAIGDARQGRGSVHFLVGAAGVGKTRLAAQVGRFASQAGLRVLRGRATAWGAVPYRPLSEVLFSALRQERAADGPELAGYRAVLARLVPEWRSAHTVPAEDSPVVIGEALLRLVGRLGHRRGCLVVLEDLHDCDPETLAVIEYVSDNLDGAPVLLVATARAQRCPALALARQLVQRGAAAMITLDGLDDRDTRRMAASRLDLPPAAVPPPLLDWLRRDTAGVPLFVEELLDQLAGIGEPRPGTVPEALVHNVNRLAARLGPATDEVLRTGAAVGRRFHPAIIGAATGLAGDELAASLRVAVTARLVASEGAAATYVFRHPLLPAALRTGLPPAQRADLCRRAAEAVEEAPPGLPAGGRRAAVELRLAAGDHPRAAAMLYEAGRHSLARGDPAAAANLFERGLRVLRPVPLAAGSAGQSADAEAGAGPAGALTVAEASGGPVGAVTATAVSAGLAGELAVSLLDALALAGRLDHAARLGERILRDMSPQWCTAIRLRLARIHARAGRPREGLHQLRLAEGDDPRTETRDSTGDGGGPVSAAGPIAERETVLARLLLATEDGDRTARRLAGQALRTAIAAPSPGVACEALEVLSDCLWPHDPARAALLCERGLYLAGRYGLRVWRGRFLHRLGAREAGRSGILGRLVEAATVARTAGDTPTVLDVSAELALAHIARGDYREAARAARRCEDAAAGLGLREVQRYGLGLRICVLAHQGRQADLPPLLAAFDRLGGDRTRAAAIVGEYGLAIGALLAEDHDRALAELSRAVATDRRQPSLGCGLKLLLATLAGGAGWIEHDALAGTAAGQLAWNRRFIAIGRAVLHGRAGRPAQAMQAVAEFCAIPAPQPLAHHLGLRLVAQAAIADGWGTPAAWLRLAAGYFQGYPHVAEACRTLLRRAGARVPQQRQGSAAIPPELRHLGVTVREYEVLGLVRGALGNQEIAHRLFLSPRTVEKHVASLLSKTGQPDRPALIRYCERLPWPEALATA